MRRGGRGLWTVAGLLVFGSAGCVPSLHLPDADPLPLPAPIAAAGSGIDPERSPSRPASGSSTPTVPLADAGADLLARRHTMPNTMPTAPDDPGGERTAASSDATSEPTVPAPAVASQRAEGIRPLALADLVALSMANNPRLAQVGWAVEAARGRAIQAGLYPNPTVSVTGDELGDRTGPGGIWTAPYVQQEIVTANKLGLSRATAVREVDQATLAAVAERYRVLTEVRQGFWELVTLQERLTILRELTVLADRSAENAKNLLKAKEGSQLDAVQLEFEAERYRTELEALERTRPAVFRQLAARVGLADLPDTAVVGDLETDLPDYDLERVRAYVLGIHPDLRSAQIGVEQARLALQRALVEPVPNVTVGAGYVRQNQNRSDDWVIGVSLPVPLWNRNQGAIRAAQAQLAEAIARVGVVRNRLVDQLAVAFARYADARKRVERYQTRVIPKAEESFRLAQKAYQGGQFEYLRVLQAQRALAEARLEYVRSLGELWQAASDIAGLMLEDDWPGGSGRPRPTPPPESP